MKKVLFASTALVATAGVAAAEIKITGSAEMGITGGSGGVVTQFHEDVDVNFKMSGETDGGLSFGVAVDLDEAAGLGTTGNNGTAVFIKGGFGTLTMGDTDGALDYALQEASIGAAGSIADNETSHAGYNGSYLDGMYDNQVVRYDNSFGDFSFAVSAELDDSAATRQANGFAVGFKYKADLGGNAITIGLGHQTSTFNNTHTAAAAKKFFGYTETAAMGAAGLGTKAKATGISVSGTFGGGFSAAVEYTTVKLSGTAAQLGAVQAAYFGGGAVTKINHMGVGVGYTSNGFTVGANYGSYKTNLGTVATKNTGYGLSAGYDLGGGAKIKAGWQSSQVGAAARTSTYSIGLALSF